MHGVHLFLIAISAFHPYAQLVTAWHSFYLEGGNPLKNKRLFRIPPWGGYKLKSKIQPSFL